MTTQTAPLAHPTYRPDIDGLRAVAILAVVAFHAFPNWVKGGFIGVDVFFVISGFLISTIIFEGLDRGTFRISEFYARRVKRIFPALLLVLTASFAFGWFALLADEYKSLGRHIAAGAGFVSNFLLRNEAGYFDPSIETKPLAHLWSLSIEEQFYILWPIVLWFSWKKKFHPIAITILVALASFALNMSGIEEDTVATFYSPQTRFWELLGGSILAWLTLYKGTYFVELKSRIKNFIFKETTVSGGGTCSNLLSLFGSLLLAYGFWRITKDVAFPGKWALLPVLGTVFIIMAGQNAWINRNILSNKVAVWFGLISFPLYLWHWPLLSFARIIESEVPSHEIRIAAVLLAVGLAWLTYELIERPVRLSGGSKAKITALVVSMALIGYAGYYTYINNGLEFRESVKLIKNQSDDLDFNFDRHMKGWICSHLTYDNPRCFYTGKDPSVAILGDSHAARIYLGLREFYASQGKGIGVFGGGGGCPPLLNVVVTAKSGKDTQHCLTRMTESIRKIIDIPSIKEVILTSRDASYTAPNGFGDVDKDRIGHWVLHYGNEEKGSRSNSDVFFGALESTIDSLIASGKKVTYLHDVPDLEFNIRSCLTKRPITLTSKTKDPCAISRADFEARTREFRSRLDKVLEARPDVKVVDLAEALCDEKYCYGAKDGVLFYIDDNHLSRRGSEYVIRRLWDKFQ